MEYALITLRRSMGNVEPFLDWLPNMFHRFLMQLVPPTDIVVPGGLVSESGAGHVVMAPVTRDILLKHPRRASTGLVRALALARKNGAQVLAAPPELGQALGIRTIQGVTTSVAGTLLAMKQILRNSGPVEIAIVGTRFREVMALLLCLADKSAGVNLVSDQSNVAERLASDLWRETGIAPRMHRSIEAAVSRSAVVLVASALDAMPAMSNSQLVVDVRSVIPETVSETGAVIVKGPAFGIMDRLPSEIELEPPAMAPLIEAAFATVEPATGFTTPRPQARDVRKVERLLKRSSIDVCAVWDGKKAVSVDTLTPSIS